MMDDNFIEDIGREDTEYWTLANGDKIKLEDMNIKHLQNCVNFIYSWKHNEYSHFIEPMEIEIELKRKSYYNNIHH